MPVLAEESFEERRIIMYDDDDAEYCPVCGQEAGGFSVFCSDECEQKYGECPRCGAPSRGNRVCFDCREE